MRIKKYIKNATILALAASLMATGVGCQKQADSIDSFDGANGINEDVSGDSSNSELSETGNYSGNNSSTAQDEKWIDTLEPADGPYSKIDINATIYEYTGVNKVVTTEAKAYDKDFVKEMCERVYGKTPEVYDYNAKTKKMYDAQIAFLEDTKEFYSNTSDLTSIDYINDDSSLDGSLQEERNDIDAMIAELESEKETAPETIENDYSYGGYIGEILGDEYYMYFGNCNFDEYPEAPITSCYDGRTCSIFRSDMKSMFDGKVGYISHYGQAGVADAYSNPPEDVKALADEFVNTIGYGDYSFSDGGSFYYEEGIYIYTLRAMELMEARYTIPKGDAGYILKYTMGGTSYDNLDAWFFAFDNYVENKQAMNYLSCIYVFVNENGIIGCQMYNPLDVKRVDDASVISIDDVKDIVAQNAGDEQAWNIASDSQVKAPEIDTVQLISFPVKSMETAGEYTFVPAYLIYDSVVGSGTLDSTSISEQLQYAPFMLINALDGSFINVSDNLKDYPAGYARGNEGYTTDPTSTWKRYTNIYSEMDDYTDFIDSETDYSNFVEETDSEESEE